MDASTRADPPAYDLIEHRHRVAIWSAARATSRGAASSGTGGVTVAHAMRWIEALGLRSLVADWRLLPEPEEFDIVHRKWRSELIEQARDDGRALTHGSAAKLINIYLKIGVVCASAEGDGQVPLDRRAKLGAVHPPIDRHVLNGLARNSSREGARFIRGLGGWSTFDSVQYEQVIELLKAFVQSPHPAIFLELWRSEQLWEGLWAEP